MSSTLRCFRAEYSSNVTIGECYLQTNGMTWGAHCAPPSTDPSAYNGKSDNYTDFCYV